MDDSVARIGASLAKHSADLALKKIADLERRVEVLERFLADVMRVAGAEGRSPMLLALDEEYENLIAARSGS